MAGEYDFPASWTQKLNAQNINATSTLNDSSISNDLKLGSEVGIEVTYGATTTGAVELRILPDDSTPAADGTAYLAAMKIPIRFVASGTFSTWFFVPGRMGNFQLQAYNPNATAVTLSMWYRQPVGAT